MQHLTGKRTPLLTLFCPLLVILTRISSRATAVTPPASVVSVLTFNSRSLEPPSRPSDLWVSRVEFDQRTRRLQEQITSLSLSISKLSSNLEVAQVRMRTEERMSFLQLKSAMDQLQRECSIKRDCSCNSTGPSSSASIPAATTTDSSNLA